MILAGYKISLSCSLFVFSTRF